MKLLSYSTFLSVIIVYAVISVFYYNEIQLCVDSILPPFDDLKTVVIYANKLNFGINPYAGKPIVYPRFSLYFVNLLGIRVNNYVFYSILLIFTFVILSVKLFKVNTIYRAIISFFLLISPSILLLLERLNIDLLIYLFIVLGLCINKRSLIFVFIKNLIFIFLALVKVYPIVLFGLVLKEDITLRLKIMTIFLMISIFLLVNIYFYEDLIIFTKSIPQPSELAFGRKVLIQEYLPKWLLNVISIVVFSLFIYLTNLFIKKRNEDFEDFIKNIHYVKLNERLFISSALLYVFSFVMSNNYDYRFVFLLLGIPFLFSLKKSNKIKHILIVFILFSLYASSFHRYFIPFQNYTQWFIGRNLLMIFKYITTSFVSAFYIIILFWVFRTILKKEINIKLSRLINKKTNDVSI